MKTKEIANELMLEANKQNVDFTNDESIVKLLQKYQIKYNLSSSQEEELLSRVIALSFERW
jgi:type III secretion system FlhB-like substrate exporter